MFHVPIDTKVLQDIQAQANNLSLELNDINSKITIKLLNVNQFFLS